MQIVKAFTDFTDDKTSMRVKVQAILGALIMNAQIYGMLYLGCKDPRYAEQL